MVVGGGEKIRNLLKIKMFYPQYKNTARMSLQEMNFQKEKKKKTLQLQNRLFLCTIHFGKKNKKVTKQNRETSHMVSLCGAHIRSGPHALVPRARPVEHDSPIRRAIMLRPSKQGQLHSVLPDADQRRLCPEAAGEVNRGSDRWRRDVPPSRRPLGPMRDDKSVCVICKRQNNKYQSATSGFSVPWQPFPPLGGKLEQDLLDIIN